MIRAFYTDRRGAGCVRTVATAAEAEKVLRGGYGAQEARIEDEAGNVIGARERRCKGEFDDRRLRWFWSLDTDAFKAPNTQVSTQA